MLSPKESEEDVDPAGESDSAGDSALEDKDGASEVGFDTIARFATRSLRASPIPKRNKRRHLRGSGVSPVTRYLQFRSVQAMLHLSETVDATNQNNHVMKYHFDHVFPEA